MANTSSTKQKSIHRVKSGVKRFLDSMAEEMKQIILTEEGSSKTKKAAKAKPKDESKGLPEEVVAIQVQERFIIEAEAKDLEIWREQLAASLRDRSERKQYFTTLHSDSEARFKQMLAKAVAQLEGVDLSESTEPALVEESQPNSETVPIPVPTVSSARPSPELLQKSSIDEAEIVSPEELAQQKNKLQETFDNFAIDAFVYDAVVGPRVTQFRVKPGLGVRVESIAALQKNISLALARPNVRIQAPIPGQPYVGVEIANGNTVPIRLRTLLESASWLQSDQIIPLAMGMDLQGKFVVTDLSKAPHLLIAGATGSGKSVCMSNLILSLLYKFAPEELELILIDPKRVEFGLFKSIPHLIHPVVSDAKSAVQVLKWVVAEMENRYQTLAERQVRNIAGFNAKAEVDGFEKMPFLVVIIDGLADLMITSKGEAEASLARIAQLSRAVGIHTIVATQRPSVNVITGVIKANYPTRVAFQVSSQVDSRTIIDGKGAESLIGQGDMLFHPPGIARLIRIQSPMLEDEEILAVVSELSNARTPQTRVDLKSVKSANGLSGIQGMADADDDEALFLEALKIVAETQRASTSFLQRRLRIGYNRAAGIIEEMEDRLHIGPQNGSIPREIFVTPEELS